MMGTESCGGHDSDSASTFTSEKGLDSVACEPGDAAADQDLEDERKDSRRSAGKRTVKQALRQQAKRRRKNTSVAAGAHGPTPRLQAHGDIDEVEVEGGVQYRQPTMAEVLASIPGWRGRIAAKGRARVRRLSAAAQLAQTERELCVDLETPDSVLVTANLRQLLNKHTFSSLPPLYQYKLLQLLPRVDRAPAPHSSYLYRLSSLGLNNEFFARACMDWRERLAEGEFTAENQAKLKAEHDREKAKLDPWKLKHFEPMWGERLEEWPALGGTAAAAASPVPGPATVTPVTPTPATAPVTPVKKKRAPPQAYRPPPKAPPRPLRTVGAVTRSLRQAAAVVPPKGESDTKKVEEVTEEDVKLFDVTVVEEIKTEVEDVKSDEVAEPVEEVKAEDHEDSVVDVASNVEVTSASLELTEDLAEEEIPQEVKAVLEEENLDEEASSPSLIEEEEEVKTELEEELPAEDKPTMDEESAVPEVEESSGKADSITFSEFVQADADLTESNETVATEPEEEVAKDELLEMEPSAIEDEQTRIEMPPVVVEEPDLVEIEVDGYSANPVGGPVVESIVTVDGTSYSIATSVAPGDPSGGQVVTTVSCVAVEKRDDSSQECQQLTTGQEFILPDSGPSPVVGDPSSWEVIKVDPDSAQSKEAVVDEEAILAAAWKAVSSHQLDQFTSDASAMDEVSVIACQEELEVTLEETHRGCEAATSMAVSSVPVSTETWAPLPSAATIRPSGSSGPAGHVKLELEVTLTPESQVSSSSGNGGVGSGLPPVVAPPTLVCLSRRPPTPSPTPPPAAPPASALPCLALTTSTPVRAVASPRPRPRPAPRPHRPPPGAVNLERSYQICQAVIDNSPNRDQLQGQLRRPPGGISSNRPRPPSAQPQPLLVRRVFTSHAGVPVNMALLPNSSSSPATHAVRYSGVRRSNSAPPGGGAAAAVVRGGAGATAVAARPASVGLALARAQRDCACALQPLRPCAKCGAFCHQDCISPSSLCIACDTN